MKPKHQKWLEEFQRLMRRDKRTTKEQIQRLAKGRGSASRELATLKDKEHVAKRALARRKSIGHILDKLPQEDRNKCVDLIKEFRNSCTPWGKPRGPGRKRSRKRSRRSH